MANESFIQPNHIYPFMWFMDLSLKGLLKAVHNIEDVIVSEKDKEMLKSLKKERVIFISNHPSTKEPPISYLMGNLMYSRFYYMASREVFDWANGAVGKVIQSIGAFSIIAGSADRESLKMTRSILAKPEGKLVLFPEGEPTGGENDNLLPFQPGVTQLGFWGYEDALKTDPNAEILILPAFIKYRFCESTENIRKDIDSSLSNMEGKLGIGKAGKTLVHRLFSIGKRLMEKNEIEYGIKPDDNQSYDYRIGRLRHTILDDVAEKLSLKKYNKDSNAIDKLRYVLSTLELVSIGAPDPKNELPPADKAKWGRKVCQKVYDFITIQTAYLDFASAERVYEWIYRFENEMFGSSNARPSKAYVNFAPVKHLSQYYAQYKAAKSKKEIVEGLTHELKESIQKLLDDEVSKSFPIFPAEFKF